MVDTPLTTRRAFCWTCTLPCTSTLDKVQEALSGTTTLVKVPVRGPVQDVLPEALSRMKNTPWPQRIPRTRSRLTLRSSMVRTRDMAYLRDMEYELANRGHCHSAQCSRKPTTLKPPRPLTPTCPRG